MAQTLRWKSFKFVKFGVRSLGFRIRSYAAWLSCLRLKAGSRVKLYLEKLACLWLTPLSVDALVLIACPTNS